MIKENIEWKNSLQGGFFFCIGGAPTAFGERDSERSAANKMIKLCQQDGVTKSEILDYAEYYLEAENVSQKIIKRELVRVDKFVGCKLDKKINIVDNGDENVIEK